MDPSPPPKKRQYKVLKAAGGDESNFDTSSEKKRDDAAVSQDSHAQIMEKGQGSYVGYLSKVMQVAGCSASPASLDSVGEDWTASCGAEVLLTPDDNTVEGKDVSDSKVEAMPAPPGVAGLFPAMSEEVYAEVEHELWKEIKLLKQRYEKIFQSLDKLEETLETTKE
ncbi:integrator complex subunit 6-like isoform X2 [Dipodomys merriami]|uniref:integrator complex subunit 6-like isoform X2 n=1 Tax=Dipodomys merriami TaxID=94247 RepID=UPI003855A151